MRTSVTATLATLAAALLAGCGQQGTSGSGGQEDPGADEETQAAKWRECTDTAYDEADGRAVRVPTGEGTVSVKLPTGGPCAGGLVARVGDGVAGLDVRGLDLDPSTAEVVRLGGATSGGPAALLRVDGGTHPRGGFQPHLFLVSESVQELTVDGRPLLPFIATDGGMAPMTVACTDDGGVAVLAATTSEPPGVVLAWDVERTTYDVSGTEVVQTGTEQLEDHIADPLLRKEMPELFEPGALFENC
jgi:hypothetical protein